jgi:hypothetical protein
MIEIKKSALQGAFGTATKGGSLVIPVVNPKDPLIVVKGPYEKAWPILVVIQEINLIVIEITTENASQILPYKRLDLYDIQRLGMIKFKELLNSSKAIYVLETLTYQNLFELAKNHNLIGFLHKEYLQSLVKS